MKKKIHLEREGGGRKACQRSNGTQNKNMDIGTTARRGEWLGRADEEKKGAGTSIKLDKYLFFCLKAYFFPPCELLMTSISSDKLLETAGGWWWGLWRECQRAAGMSKNPVVFFYGFTKGSSVHMSVDVCQIVLRL